MFFSEHASGLMNTFMSPVSVAPALREALSKDS